MLSGSLESVRRILDVMEGQRVFFTLLDLDYAFHCSYMDGLLLRLEKMSGRCVAGSASTISLFFDR
ncbi:hypothetical protein D3M96_18185 [Alcaligenes aquatilis]|uniref:Acyltransferase domain-containing protein n=1 Tax=Alcaligenes aquatilis TaxID=323284 RepID=A0A3G2HZ00_9BURK|nr:hypothetical protein D3M96_18185 [Alcaligenes aquatilis]